MANICLHVDSKDRFSVLNSSVAFNTPTVYPQGETVNQVGLNPVNPGSGTSIRSTDLQGYVLGAASTGVPGNYALQPLANNFTIQAPGPLVYGYIKNIKVASVNLQYDLPTVIPSIRQGIQTSFGNDIIRIQRQGAATPNQFRIPHGYYTPNELCAFIQGEVRAAVTLQMPDFTAVYSPRDGFVFRSNNVENFRFVMLREDFTAVQIRNGIYDIALRTLRMFGLTFKNYQYSDIQYGGKGTMLYTNYIDICSNNLCKYQRNKDTDSDPKKTSNIVCRFYLAGNQPEILDEDQGLGTSPFSLLQHYNTTKTIRWSAEEAVYELDFQLRDMYGDLLYMGNVATDDLSPENLIYTTNTNFQMTLLCFEDTRH